MFKLFLAILTLVFLGIIGAFSVFTPLINGANENLAHPKSPFNMPIPQPVADAVDTQLSHITPTMWLIGLLVVLGACLLYTLLTACVHRFRRWRRGSADLADLRYQGRVTYRRQDNATEQKQLSRAELEQLWK